MTTHEEITGVFVGQSCSERWLQVSCWWVVTVAQWPEVRRWNVVMVYGGRLVVVGEHRWLSGGGEGGPVVGCRR
ncbi:hypothetical protein Hanom_Chr12g01136391 [Helianthus anomalus]